MMPSFPFRDPRTHNTPPARAIHLQMSAVAGARGEVGLHPDRLDVVEEGALISLLEPPHEVTILCHAVYVIFVVLLHHPDGQAFGVLGLLEVVHQRVRTP